MAVKKQNSSYKNNKNKIFYKIKIMYKYFIIGLIIVFLIGCNRQKSVEQNRDYITVSVNPKKALKSINMSEIFSEIEYIPLENVDKHMIGWVHRLIAYKNRFYIFDESTQSVFCFQQDGKFLFELNRKGTGPGEYVKLMNIGIDHDNDHLLLCCGKIKRMHVYDLEGNYINSKSYESENIWANDFLYIGNDYVAFYGCYTTNAQYSKNGMTPNLLIAGTDDYKVKHTDIFFPSEIDMSAVVGNRSHFSSYQNGTVSVLAEYNDTVFYISEGKVEPAYYIDFGDMKKDESFYSFLKRPTTVLGTVPEYEKTHNICNMTTLVETKTDMFFIYHHKFIHHFAFYNKETEQIIDVYNDFSKNNGDPFHNDIDGGPFACPLSTDSESFFGVIEPYDILELKESIRASTAVGKDKLLKILDGMSEFDNPIIVKMKMKK
jgi:hypothetical protein